MSRPRIAVLPDGRAYPVAMLRIAIADARRPAASQPALFELRPDHRPPGERNAAERYAAPSLLAYLEDRR